MEEIRMVKKSWLPPGGINLFQEIKRQCEVVEKGGKRIIKLSIGQPQGPALLSARKGAASAVMEEDEEMHGYQDNGCPGIPGFAEQFVAAHVKRSLNIDGISFLPIPGIKPMLGIVPLAIGSRLYKVGTMTEPGYPTPADQCRYFTNTSIRAAVESAKSVSFRDDSSSAQDKAANAQLSPLIRPVKSLQGVIGG